MIFGPEKLELSPEQEIEIKTAIFSQYNNLFHYPREEGTCKKMVNLSHLNSDWSALAVAFSHHADAKHSQIMHDERKFLAYLDKQGYPVVQVFGDEFVIGHDMHGNAHFGMLMRYIPGVFIEAKTPAPLKVYLIAALLGITYIKPQEAWLALNKNRLIHDIQELIQDPDTFAKLQQRAKILLDNFDALIKRFESQGEIVVDLQMLISADGTLTLIDPLDVLIQTKDKFKSILPEAPAPSDDLKKFIKNTKGWLRAAKDVCNKISTAHHYADLSALLNLDVSPMIFSSPSDPKGHSRISRLKSQSATLDGAVAKPSSEKKLSQLK